MPFVKGKQKTGGRQKGVQNSFTRTVKETVLEVFNKIQDDPKVNLEQFAKKFPRDFYQIAAKLIPTEITGTIKTTLRAKIVDDAGS
jgi:hypothetical protein